MADVDSLINRLMEQAKDMDGAPSNERRPIALSFAELAFVVKGLALLTSIRTAVE